MESIGTGQSSFPRRKDCVCEAWYELCQRFGEQDSEESDASEFKENRRRCPIAIPTHDEGTEKKKTQTRKVALKALKAVVEVDDYEALSESEEYQQSIPSSEDFPAADPSGRDGPVAEGDGPLAADTSVLTENGKRRMTHQQGSMEKRRAVNPKNQRDKIRLKKK